MSKSEPVFESFDKILCSQTRLAIMTLLFKGDEMDFVFLKDKLNLTDGNLSIHLRTLEQAGYIKVKKSFFERRPKSTYKITPKGQQNFINYVKILETIIKKR
ncbi:MAG: transcriptional regulator [Planctomycetota bacterium]